MLFALSSAQRAEFAAEDRCETFEGSILKNPPRFHEMRSSRFTPLRILREWMAGRSKRKLRKRAGRPASGAREGADSEEC